MSRLSDISASPVLREFAQGAAQSAVMPVADFIAPTVEVNVAVEAAPKATVNWGCSGTISAWPPACSTARRSAGLRAPPPQNTIRSGRPKCLSIAAMRSAMMPLTLLWAAAVATRTAW